MTAENFEDLFDLRFSMWMATLNHENWAESTCTCPAWQRDGMCKHLVGLGLSAKDITLPQKLIGKKLKMPLKRKPPALAVKALVYQPNYAPPSNNINTDNMDSP